jgi:predicted  nucleic acid-binding Zn-ribbon protein
MNLGKRLYELQQLDLDLAKTVELLSKVERQLEHNEPLAAARADLETGLNSLSEFQQRQKAAEWALDDLEAKLKPIKQKLYAGSVKNPKELVSMQQQASQLQSQVREEEDKILEIMSQIEALQKQTTVKTARVATLEQEWTEKKQQLLSEKAELTAVLDATRKKREGLLHNIDTTYVEIYENMRVRKHGLAVAKIEQGRCQGCRISVPLSEVTQARAGDLVQCGSCGRVLCLG